jgi:hypothetical protein
MEPVQPELEQQHGLIQLAAYYLWERRGSPIGTPEEDWFRAEEQLRGQNQDPDAKPAVIAVAESLGSALGKLAGLVASAGG